MTSMTMDTHRIVKRFKDAGFTEAQAELITDVVRETVRDSIEELATKNDLDKLEFALRSDIKQLRLELIVQFGGMLIIAVGVILTAMRFMLPH